MLILAIATITLIVTAARIEVLNASAQLLPRNERREDGSLTKWRQSLWTNEPRWREFLGPKAGGLPVDRPLTADERARMDKNIGRAIADNRLRDILGTWGLLQYLLAPTALVIGALFMIEQRARRFQRAVGVVGFAVAVGAAALIWHREYYSSLGW